MTHAEREIASQPDCWGKAAELAGQAKGLPRHGERVAVVGCGTSWFIAQSYAALREMRGHGETDAFAASEFPRARAYDRVLAITRSGTTSETVQLLQAVHPASTTTVLTAVAASPAAQHANSVLVLDFADERSVVQTRFATTTLALLRAGLGEDLGAAIADARGCAQASLPPAVLEGEQVTYLGTGWTVGLAAEAALKMREAAGMWAESYPAMEYRHGPISIAQPGRAVWVFGTPPSGLMEEITAAGAAIVASEGIDPLAHLVLAQRCAIARGHARGLDPDRPRHLSRSVVLDQA